MQKFIIGIAFLALCAAILYNPNPSEIKKYPKQKRLKDLKEFEELKTKDPALNRVPRERLYKIRKKLIDDRAAYKGNSTLSWEERGPDNFGGRTRAIMFDNVDPSGNTIWAGGVAGGLWKCTRAFGNYEWREILTYPGAPAIGAIGQDPNDSDIIYVSTGEAWLNGFGGDGVYKTTNGGATWNRLDGTSDYTFSQDILVMEDRIFVSTSNRGIQVSRDGGDTWSTSLSDGSGARSSYGGDLELASDGTLYATMGSIFGGRDGIYRSRNNGNSWTRLNLPINNQFRISVTTCRSNPDVVVALLEVASNIQIIKSTDAGESWTRLDAPGAFQMANFARGQGFHNNTLAIDPEDEDRIYIGGIDLLLSEDGGESWEQISQWFGGNGLQYVHADQMSMMYVPGDNERIMFSNDGGIFVSENADASNPVIRNINKNYNVLQFYSCAIHPNPNMNVILGGTQDNGSHLFRNPGINSTEEVTGGDGAFCFIDQDNPNIQITSYIYNNYFITKDGWNSVTTSENEGGFFINPSDYDDENNVLYTSGESQKLMMLSIDNLRWEEIFIDGLNGHRVSAVKVNPSNSNEVFVGTDDGALLKITDPFSEDPTIQPLFLRPSYLSNIDIDPTDRDRILITYSNFGVQSVYVSEDGGNRFISIEGDLPDMPVRWGIFNPMNPKEVLIGTEVGVWATFFTEDGFSTNWYLFSDNLPLTRIDMLEVRPDDGLIVAATHGRGMYTSTLTDDIKDVDGDGYFSDVDCNDLNQEANPGQTEIPYNGFDDDCNALTPDDDLDGDGFIEAFDCDDNDPSVNPAALEIDGNDIDENCDFSKTGYAPCLQTDRGPLVVSLDSDNCSAAILNSGMNIRNGDAYAITNVNKDQSYYFNFCSGYSESTFDAKISVAEYNVISQSIGEVINVVADCGVLIRHDFPASHPDMYIVINRESSCDPTPQVVRNGILSFGCLGELRDRDNDGYFSDVDCDDYNRWINAGRAEIPYNDIDDDCNPMTRDDDIDGDGFLLANDCDDENPDINPLAEEITNNGIDENCDGDDVEVVACDVYTNLVTDFTTAGRCNDGAIKTNSRVSSNQGYIIRRPNGNQVYYFDMCDGYIANNFASSLSVYAYNQDKDELGELIKVSFNCRVEFYHLHTIDYPDAIILVNKQDCGVNPIPSQGGFPEVGCLDFLTDRDEDGYISSEDCDDENPSVNRGMEEIPYNGLDDDCNPQTYDDDLDQDGFLAAFDCDDNNDQIYPGAFDSDDTAVDEDCSEGYGNAVCSSQYQYGPVNLQFRTGRCLKQTRPNVQVMDSEAFVINDLIENKVYYFDFCDGYSADIFEANVVVRFYNNETRELGGVIASQVGCRVEFGIGSDSVFDDVLIIITDNQDCQSTSQDLQNGSPSFGCKLRISEESISDMGDINLQAQIDNDGRYDTSVQIYPNPASVNLNIAAPFDNYQISITNLEGKLVSKTSNQTEIDVSGIADGIYLVSIQDVLSGDVVTEKLAVVR